MRRTAYALMRERSWPFIAGHYRGVIPSSSTFEGAPSLAPVREESTAVTVHQSAVYAEASNAVVAVSIARNENWVDGVGPGWYPTDTYVSRYRPVWGVDSIVMSGCFVRRVMYSAALQRTALKPRA